jgi:hypothetical protein
MDDPLVTQDLHLGWPIMMAIRENLVEKADCQNDTGRAQKIGVAFTPFNYSNFLNHLVLETFV